MVVQGNWTLSDLSAGERGWGRTVRDTPQNILGGSSSSSQAGPGAMYTVSWSFRRVDVVTVVAKAGSEVKIRSPQCPNPLFFSPYSRQFLVTGAEAEAGVRRFWRRRRKWSCPHGRVSEVSAL